MPRKQHSNQNPSTFPDAKINQTTHQPQGFGKIRTILPSLAWGQIFHWKYARPSHSTESCDNAHTQKCQSLALLKDYIGGVTSCGVISLHNRKSCKNRGISSSLTFIIFSGLMCCLRADRQHLRKDLGESSSLSSQLLNHGILSHKKITWNIEVRLSQICIFT